MNREERRKAERAEAKRRRLGAQVARELATPVDPIIRTAFDAAAPGAISDATAGAIVPYLIQPIWFEDDSLPASLIFGFEDAEELGALGEWIDVAVEQRNPMATVGEDRSEWVAGWRSARDERGLLAALWVIDAAGAPTQKVFVDTSDRVNRAKIAAVVTNGGIVWCGRRSALTQALVRDDFDLQALSGCAAAFPSVAAPILAEMLHA